MDISNVKDKIVYVASPYAGDIEKNVRYAQDACRAVLLAGAHPYAPICTSPTSSGTMFRKSGSKG